MVGLHAIAGFRLVSQAPDRLAAFYAAIGFAVTGTERIAAEELAALGFSGGGERTRMRLGEQHVAIDAYDVTGAPYPGDDDAAALAFQHLAIVTDDADAAWARAVAAGAVAISRDAPVTLPQSSGGVTAIKFRDPEGHPLEFLQFPVGRSRWRGTGLLGIDHSAISIGDTTRSRNFYVGRGLTAESPTCNTGPGQERLDALDDVRVAVTPMRPETGSPHLELLGYGYPRGAASAWRPNDVVATRIVWHADTVGLIRDPDGHLHELTIQDGRSRSSARDW